MPRRSPCASDPPYGPCSNTFPQIPHTASQLQKIRHQIQQDQRHGPANQSLTNPADSRRALSGAVPHHGAPGVMPLHIPHPASQSMPFPPRPAAGPLKPAHPTGLTTFPAPASGFNRLSSNPTHSNSNDWGAWASTTASLRRPDVMWGGGGAACYSPA